MAAYNLKAVWPTSLLEVRECNSLSTSLVSNMTRLYVGCLSVWRSNPCHALLPYRTLESHSSRMIRYKNINCVHRSSDGKSSRGLLLPTSVTAVPTSSVLRKLFVQNFKSQDVHVKTHTMCALPPPLLNVLLRPRMPISAFLVSFRSIRTLVNFLCQG